MSCKPFGGICWPGRNPCGLLLGLSIRGEITEEVQRLEHMKIPLEIVRIRWSETYGFLLAHAAWVVWNSTRPLNGS